LGSPENGLGGKENKENVVILFFFGISVCA